MISRAMSLGYAPTCEGVEEVDGVRSRAEAPEAARPLGTKRCAAGVGQGGSDSPIVVEPRPPSGPRASGRERGN